MIFSLTIHYVHRGCSYVSLRRVRGLVSRGTHDIVLFCTHCEGLCMQVRDKLAYLYNVITLNITTTRMNDFRGAP